MRNTPVPVHAATRVDGKVDNVTPDLLPEAVPDTPRGVEEQAAVAEGPYVVALVDHQPWPVLPRKPQHVNWTLGA